MKIEFKLDKNDLYNYNYDMFTKVKVYKDIIKKREKSKYILSTILYLIILIAYELYTVHKITFFTPLATILFIIFLFIINKIFYTNNFFYKYICRIVNRYIKAGMYTNSLKDQYLEFDDKIIKKCNGETIELEYNSIDNIIKTTDFIYMIYSDKAIIIPLYKIDNKDSFIDFIYNKFNDIEIYEEKRR